MTRRKKQKRRFTANVALGSAQLCKNGAGLKIMAYHADSKIGTLHIGRGGIRWVRARAQHGVKKNWKQFATLMEEE